MSTQLQEIVDTLAAQIDHAVAIDDPHFRLVVHSPHHEPVDDVRMGSIMRREVPPEVTEYSHKVGVHKARGPVRLPANPDLGMWSRMCVPIRCEDILLGYLFFIDADGTCGDDDVALAESAAHMAGMVLYQERLLEEVERARERELLQDLLNGDLSLRRKATDELIERELLTGDAAATVFAVAHTTPGETGPRATEFRFAVNMALEDARKTIFKRHGLHSARPGHGVLLVTSHDVDAGQANAVKLANTLHASMIKRLEAQGIQTRVVVGVGEPQGALIEAPESYRQATYAVRVASVVPSLGDVLLWRNLGIYRFLSTFSAEELTPDAIHSGIGRLLDADHSDILLQTLEAYLDHAGNTQETAATLYLHRTTLYHRLRQVEKIAEADLSRGDDRLALHLGLKLARLSGLSWPQSDGRAEPVAERRQLS